MSASRRLYYLCRPLLPVAIRKHLQKVRLTGWEAIQFPRWPVDTTVDNLMQRTMALLMKTRGISRIPFVWFWPDGAPGCAVITHDVEGPAGRDFCGQLMDLDDSYGVKSAFQVVPDGRRRGSGLPLELERRGFEVNIHDFNHDGYLFTDRKQFLRRAAEINRYARELRCKGFRSGSMYRRQEWYDTFEFSYDMSVPNVAHLEPQRGGCCTVMPYFIGHVLELPVTTTQDYSLFHILGDYSTRLWRQQIDLILAQNGLINVITHPDYLIDIQARAVYRELLEHVSRLRAQRGVWVTVPGEVDRWWRSRSRMKIVPDRDGWRIDGSADGRAKIAFATLRNDSLVYTVDGIVVNQCAGPDVMIQPNAETR